MKDVKKASLAHLDKYLTDGIRRYFYLEAGQEHYKLLNVLCEGLELVYDIGSHNGASAVAMSSANKVKSFDIEDKIEVTKPDNVTFSLKEYINKDLLKADLILIDIDHSGKTEKKIYNYLLKNKYKGIVVFDDIYYNIPMQSFWNSIKEPKEDWTHVGHYTGTGIVRLK